MQQFDCFLNILDSISKKCWSIGFSIDIDF